MSFLRGLHLADPEFDHSGKIDILLDIAACNECTYDDVVSSPNHRFKAHKTIFGWAIGGERPAGESPDSTTCLKASVKEDLTCELLRKFWKLEEVPGSDSDFTTEETQAMHEGVQRDPNGRYRVTLPRKDPIPELGESREMAHSLSGDICITKRASTGRADGQCSPQQQKSMRCWLVPARDLNKPLNQVFYLCME